MQVRALLVVALVLLAAGCGGSKKKSAAPVTTATTAPATTTTQAAQQGAAPSFKSAKNCQELAALGAQVAKSLQASSGDLKSAVANEQKALDAMARAVPADIRSDFQTFADAFRSYVDAIEKIQIKPGSVPTASQIAQLTEAGKALSTPKLQAAEQHLTAWASKNCGGVTTTSG